MLCSPQVRPIEFKFEEGGALYFDTVEFYASYAELQAHPTIQACVCDPQTMAYVRVGGTVNFTKDPAVVECCFAASSAPSRPSYPTATTGCQTAMTSGRVDAATRQNSRSLH